MKKILYNELRQIKDSLPHGSIAKIATELGYSVETVRNYFMASTHEIAETITGIHYEKGGAEGGIVVLYDTAILEAAMRLLKEDEIY